MFETIKKINHNYYVSDNLIKVMEFCRFWGVRNFIIDNESGKTLYYINL